MFCKSGKAPGLNAINKSPEENTVGLKTREIRAEIHAFCQSYVSVRKRDCQIVREPTYCRSSTLKWGRWSGCVKPFRPAGGPPKWEFLRIETHYYVSIMKFVSATPVELPFKLKRFKDRVVFEIYLSRQVFLGYTASVSIEIGQWS